MTGKDKIFHAEEVIQKGNKISFVPMEGKKKMLAMKVELV